MMIYVLFVFILSATLGILLWPAKKHAVFCAAVACFFFIGTFGFYHLVGTPQILPLLKERDEKLAILKADITTHSEAIKQHPDDLRAWVSLGQDFIETGQYDAAANAFKRAVILSNGNPKLILAYAKATIFAEGGKVSDQAKKSLEMVLLQQPKNPDARYYLIVRKLQDGNASEAMKEMKALYRELPNDSPLKEMIDKQIGR